MQRQRNFLRVLFSIMAAQVAAMSLMIGAAALVVDSSAADDAGVAADQNASAEPARSNCKRSSALDLIVL